FVPISSDNGARTRSSRPNRTRNSSELCCDGARRQLTRQSSPAANGSPLALGSSQPALAICQIRAAGGVLAPIRKSLPTGAARRGLLPRLFPCSLWRCSRSPCISVGVGQDCPVRTPARWEPLSAASAFGTPTRRAFWCSIRCCLASRPSSQRAPPCTLDARSGPPKAWYHIMMQRRSLN
ncbi:uncharacterized protein B0H18DRAFT_983188, partial [Fomitopsis serialis]|uniref:uncharacterized protein n=1 Tax=Fomitopsis serialis TaxID=139415 RepID=UPI002007240D